MPPTEAFLRQVETAARRMPMVRFRGLPKDMAWPFQDVARVNPEDVYLLAALVRTPFPWPFGPGECIWNWSLAEQSRAASPAARYLVATNRTDLLDELVDARLYGPEPLDAVAVGDLALWCMHDPRVDHRAFLFRMRIKSENDRLYLLLKIGGLLALFVIIFRLLPP